MRAIMTIAVAAAVLLPGAAFAADAPKCGQLEIVNRIYR